MAKLLKVEGHDFLYRDASSGAIINNSDTEYNRYMQHRKAFLKRKEEIEVQKEEIDNLKDELSEIKNLLKKLLEK